MRLYTLSWESGGIQVLASVLYVSEAIYIRFSLVRFWKFYRALQNNKKIDKYIALIDLKITDWLAGRRMP